MQILPSGTVLKLLTQQLHGILHVAVRSQSGYVLLPLCCGCIAVQVGSIQPPLRAPSWSILACSSDILRTET